MSEQFAKLFGKTTPTSKTNAKPEQKENNNNKVTNKTTPVTKVNTGTKTPTTTKIPSVLTKNVSNDNDKATTKNRKAFGMNKKKGLRNNLLTTKIKESVQAPKSSAKVDEFLPIFVAEYWETYGYDDEISFSNDLLDCFLNIAYTVDIKRLRIIISNINSVNMGEKFRTHFKAITAIHKFCSAVFDKASEKQQGYSWKSFLESQYVLNEMGFQEILNTVSSNMNLYMSQVIKPSIYRSLGFEFTLDLITSNLEGLMQYCQLEDAMEHTEVEQFEGERYAKYDLKYYKLMDPLVLISLAENPKLKHTAQFVWRILLKYAEILDVTPPVLKELVGSRKSYLENFWFPCIKSWSAHKKILYGDKSTKMSRKLTEEMFTGNETFQDLLDILSNNVPNNKGEQDEDQNI